jgi:DNA-binding NtrC family response regulator
MNRSSAKLSEPAEERGARSPNLLIVDDENNVALTLRMVFEDSGYRVTTAQSCATALDSLHGPETYDAVITDLCMEEERSGLHVATAAAQLRPRPVIVLVTGFGTFENVKAAVGKAVDHFALKPLDLDELKHVVSRLILIRRDRLG